MSKKLSALIFASALILVAAFGSYRALDVRARGAAAPRISIFTNLSTGDLAFERASVPVTGPAVKSYTNLATSDLQHQARQGGAAPRPEVSIWTNLATSDLESANRYAMMDWTNIATSDLQYQQP
jgi:hypothetical protein